MSNSAAIVSVTTESFADQVLAASRERLVLVDFWAAWCGPCKALAPILEKVAEVEGHRLVIAKVDVDAEPELASRYGIRALPTLALFRDGSVVDQIVGLQSAEAIRSHLRTVPFAA